MELTKNAIEQLQLEIKQAIDAQPQDELVPAGISIASICENKAIIMGFLQTLIALIPGMLGKIAGQAILKAAEAWFEKKKCSS